MDELFAERGTEHLTRKLRERLQEMTAAVYELGSRLGGESKAEQALAVLRRDICAQLRLVRQLELAEQLSSPNEVRLYRKQTDLVPLCRGVVEKTDALTRPLLDIRVELVTSLPMLLALVDGQVVEDMLLELISNAVHAIGQSGRVRLELECQGDQAIFTLSDTGGGLDTAALEDLFDLEDEDGEKKLPPRGLPLAWRAARLHGGRLVAGNTEGAGARVAVSIPIVEQATGVLHSPFPPMAESGWNPVLVTLSDCLPVKAFRQNRHGR